MSAPSGRAPHAWKSPPSLWMGSTITAATRFGPAVKASSTRARHRASSAAFSAAGTAVILYGLRMITSLRATRFEEEIGVDVSEHNENAYAREGGVQKDLGASIMELRQLLGDR